MKKANINIFFLAKILTQVYQNAVLQINLITGILKIIKDLI